MKDLYKKANFPTRFDIFGKEYYVREVRYDKKFNIELFFGRPVDCTMGGRALIFTEELKALIVSTSHLSHKEFTGELKFNRVARFRRLLKKNPYNSYREWAESKDKNKPKEITLLNVKNNPEYITDYLGVKYIILSAIMSPGGFPCPQGVEVKTYHIKDKKTKKYILTHDLVKQIKQYFSYPHKGIHLFPFGMQTFIELKRELGGYYYAYDTVNIWLAAHLDKIIHMTAQNFLDTYAEAMHISKNTIFTVKASLHHLKAYKEERVPDGKEILRLMKKYIKKQDSDIRKKIISYIGEAKLRDDTRALKLLELAEEYNHPIPRGYKKILTQKKLK